MVFSSAVFLFVFLPVLFLLCRLPVGLRVQNGILIVFSLIFYAYGEPVYVLLMIASSLINYFFARGLGAGEGRAALRKTILILAVVFNIGMLAFFKYTDFLLDNLNHLTGLSIPLPGIRLPIGISFFTFQALSYCIDVYRDPRLMQKNYFAVLLYISFFPQLVAGPIVRYADIAAQIRHREITSEKMTYGAERFIKGLFKKLFLANTCGLLADRIFGLGGGETGFLLAWLGALSYALQIYYDFSAYSDMAIGLGRLFGFEFKENFDHPYASASIREFWRRWHISLSSWFREYVYIPLGGNRKGKGRTAANRLFVFLLTGIWHGANWTFVIWGLIHGVVSTVEKGFKHRFAGNLYVWLVATLAFVFFRADSLSEGALFLKSMFTQPMDQVSSGLLLEALTPWNVVMLLTGIVFAYPVSSAADRWMLKKLPRFREPFYMAASLVLLILCLLHLASGSYNPFIYFRF